MKKNLQKFGELLKNLRIEKNLSLREICKLADYDPSNWSKIERGKMAPPSDKNTLIKWTKIFGLLPNKKELNDFIDCAAIAQGIIPEDILSDADTVKLLPAFFRTMRDEKPTKREIEALFKLIKNNK
ncbi:MAG: helix-turn-helix transcriptional regulator [Patescibacteria group bacterium]|jgi:transcriptional regulator with XRE-family HTH domain